MNIQIAVDGAVHVKRFSWHTACGKDFDTDDRNVAETSKPVTCGKCQSQRRYLHVGEIDGFGILIDRNEEQTELVNELRDKWYGDDKKSVDMIPYTYVIKVFAPFQALGKECISMIAHLPDDEAAINLAEMYVWWRIGVIQGKLFTAVPVPTIHLEPA